MTWCSLGTLLPTNSPEQTLVSDHVVRPEQRLPCIGVGLSGGVLLVQTRSRPQWGVLLVPTLSRPQWGVLLVQTRSRPQWGVLLVQTRSRPQWGVLLVQTRSRPQWGVLLVQTRSRPTLRSRFPEERAGQNTSAACVLCVCGAEVNPAQSHNSEQSGGILSTAAPKDLEGEDRTTALHRPL
ncbi:unnamed protein product [Arctogadus glacialis]